MPDFESFSQYFLQANNPIEIPEEKSNRVIQKMYKTMNKEAPSFKCSFQ